MKKILIPQLNANDSSCGVKQIHFKAGDQVNVKDVLITLETSKAVIDIECKDEGYFYPVAKEEDDLKTGELVAYVFESMSELEEFRSHQTDTEEKKACISYKLSKQAIEFMKEYDFTEEELSSLQKKIIKVSDLEQLLKVREEQAQNVLSFTKNQKQVAKVVTLSNETIPKAFLSMKIHMNAAIAKMQEISDEYDTIIGIGDVLPVVLAALKEEFPFFYGTRKDDSTFVVAKAANIGITIDTGSGLFIPVLKEEQLSSVEQVSETLFEFRYKAMRNEFEAEDLMGGVISISLNTNTDILSVIPIITPGQVAMISAGSVLNELVLEDGAVVQSQYILLGLAYDHRVVNGAYAAEFAAAIKDKLENCDF